jgi:hypothetical protein
MGNIGLGVFQGTLNISWVPGVGQPGCHICSKLAHILVLN